MKYNQPSVKFDVFSLNYKFKWFPNILVMSAEPSIPRKRKAHDAFVHEGHSYQKNVETSDGTTVYYECSE